MEKIALDRGDPAWIRVDCDSGDVPGGADKRALDHHLGAVRLRDQLSFLFEVAR